MTTELTSHRATGFALQSFVETLLLPDLIQLTERVVALSSDSSVDQIHQSRVLIRTLRGQLNTFSPLFRRQAALKAKRQLKSLDALLGALRNIDVIVAFLARDTADLAAGSKTETELRRELMQRLTEQREAQMREVLDQLLTGSVLELIPLVSEFAGDRFIRHRTLAMAAHRQQQLLRKCLNNERRKLLKRVGKSSDKLSSRKLHRVRIQAKQVHYSYEAARSQRLIEDTRIMTLAKDLHRILGKHQDLVMFASWLKEQEVPGVTDVATQNQWLQRIKHKRRKAIKRYRLWIKELSF